MVIKAPQPRLSIEPFPGGRLVRYLKDGSPHLLIQITGDQLAAALRSDPAAARPPALVQPFPMPRTEWKRSGHRATSRP
jgi:hypothetical protein